MILIIVLVIQFHNLSMWIDARNCYGDKTVHLWELQQVFTQLEITPLDTLKGLKSQWFLKLIGLHPMLLSKKEYKI